ncbi:hypothetical protein [Silvibacterium dinghuense]|uniref:hypothetical protein n=1 Tax=Silvibacterium dinghuense TaxID=1560006 RepID=UPI0013E96EC2|nr:hypothetical protein [Silvibacterium dinghuense]
MNPRLAQRRQTPRHHTQRNQIGGLLILAAVLAIFTLLRAQPHTVFPAGWWRFW